MKGYHGKIFLCHNLRIKDSNFLELTMSKFQEIQSHMECYTLKE